MPTMTIRNIPEEVHRALKIRAATSGRSAEAEVRQILEAATRPVEQVPQGQRLVEIGRRMKLTDDEHALFEQLRDRQPHEPMSLD